MNTLARPVFTPNKYRSIFISDVHLGSYGCQASKLLEFLENNSCDQLFLVGDIVDGWQMRGRVYWPQSHERVMQHLLQRAKEGTKVRYITGNHDEFLRNYGALKFDNIEIVDEYRLQNKDGRDFLVIHGDQYDVVTQHAPWIATLGDIGYNQLPLGVLAQVLANTQIDESCFFSTRDDLNWVPQGFFRLGNKGAIARELAKRVRAHDAKIVRSNGADALSHSRQALQRALADVSAQLPAFH